MMKSFFKKLSLVMALAMVVSLVAPAGSAFAAEAGIALQGTKTVVDAIDVEVGGDVVDLCFLGAPADWKSTFKWTPGDETIASVDKAGKVTGLKAGETTVTITAGADGSYKHTVKVTVTEPKVEMAYEAYQTSEITFDVDFNKAVSYGRDDVQLYRIFDTDEGPVYVVWAVEKAWLDEAKDTLTVQPYVQFGDGERYLVKFANDEEGYEFITYIGDITSVEITWVSKDDEGLEAWGKAYTNGEEAEDDIDVVLGYKVFSGKVDLTNIYKNRNDFDISYEMVVPEESDYIDHSDDTLVFTKEKQTAGVRAEVSYENGEGEDVTISSPITYITSELLPPLDVAYIKSWTIVGTDNSADWSKAVDHDLRAGKDGYIELVLVDNRGTTWVTSGAGSLWGSKTFGAEDSATEEMYLTFHSTNTDRFVVGDKNGKVEAYNKKDHAVIYITLHNEELLEDNESDVVRNIGAIDLTLLEPAELAGLVLKEGTDFWNDKTISSVTLVTDAVDDPANSDSEYFVEKLTTTEVYVFPVDQDGAPYTSTGYMDYAMSTKNDDVQEDLIDTGALDVTNGYIHVDAKDLEAVAGNSSYTFNVAVTEYDENSKKIDFAKTSFRVSAKDPEIDENAAAGEEDVIVEGWGLSAKDAGLQPKNGYSEAKINITMLSNKQVVGYYNRYDMTSATGPDATNKITIVTDKDAYQFGNDVADGDCNVPGIYVMVEGPDGKPVQAASGSGLGVYVNEDNYYVGVRVTADDDTRKLADGTIKELDGIVDYLETGDYTVYVTFVTPSEEAGKVDTKKRTTSFEVYDNLKHVFYDDMYDVETSLDIAGVDDEDIVDLIWDNYKFLKEYNQWNPGLEVLNTFDWAGNVEINDSVTIAEWDCKIKGEYILINSITFHIDAGGDKVYVSHLDDIDKSVRFGVDE